MARVLLATLTGILVLAGGAAAGTVVGIGEQSQGSLVRLQRGDTLVVSLGANATTGYSWRVAAVDRHVLAPDASGYVAARHAPGIVGSGGVAVLTFRAVAAGRTALKLAYVSPGRKPTAARRFAVVVLVR